MSQKEQKAAVGSNVESPLMTPDEVAAYLRISKATVYSKRCRGEFPEGSIVKVFGKLMFLREKIDQLIADSVESTLKKF